MKPAATFTVPAQTVEGIYSTLHPFPALGTRHLSMLKCVGDSRDFHTSGKKSCPDVIERIFIVDGHPGEAIKTPDSRLFHARRPF
ncbi:MAG: hypothetical protein OXU79_13530 [Gemmatimonadota bacterium]|nr:hypothetical protein [Gemmatimonadota bacterium]